MEPRPRRYYTSGLGGGVDIGFDWLPQFSQYKYCIQSINGRTFSWADIATLMQTLCREYNRDQTKVILYGGLIEGKSVKIKEFFEESLAHENSQRSVHETAIKHAPSCSLNGMDTVDRPNYPLEAFYAIRNKGYKTTHLQSYLRKITTLF